MDTMTMQSSKFPTDAEVVIVGVGGIVGSMLAYWLTELGQKNIVGLEKSSTRFGLCLQHNSRQTKQLDDRL